MEEEDEEDDDDGFSRDGDRPRVCREGTEGGARRGDDDDDEESLESASGIVVPAKEDGH